MKDSIRLSLFSVVLAFLVFLFIPVEAGELSLAGEWSYSTDYASSMATLVGGKIVNRASSGKSGELLVALILTAGAYDGTTNTGHILAAFTFGPLAAGYSYNNVRESARYTTPSFGTYHVTLILAEKSGDSYSVVDYKSFVNTVTYKAPDPQLMMMMMMMMNQSNPYIGYSPGAGAGNAYLCQKCRENVANACAHAQDPNMLGTTQASFAALCAKGCANVCR